MISGIPTHSTTPEEIKARLGALLTNADQKLLVEMITGYEEGLGITSSFATESGKLSHLVCIYPIDVVRLLSQSGPIGELPDRMRARGCIIVPMKLEDKDALAIAYPLVEALRLAKIWRGTDKGNHSRESLTLISPGSDRLIIGEIEVM